MKFYVIQRDCISPNFEIFELGEQTQEQAQQILEEEIAENQTSEWLLEEDEFKALKSKMEKIE